MKKIIIGLAALFSMSVFANCDVGSIECHLGTYKGTNMLNPSDGDWDGSCEIEIKKSNDKKNEIVYKHTATYPALKIKRVNGGKLSIKSQMYEVHDDVARNGFDVASLELNTDITKDSNKTLNTLKLTFNDQEQIDSMKMLTRIHQPLKSKLFSKLDAKFGGNGIYEFDTEQTECHNIVKIK